MRLTALLTAPLLVAGALVALASPASAATVTASAAPISPESCLARPASAVSTLSGSLTGSQGSRTAESDRTWDLRGFTHTANPNPTRYPFRLDAAKRACVIGGSVIGNIPRDWPRSAWYHGTDTSADWDGEGYRLTQTADSPWLYQHGSYVENVSDGFDPNGVANGVNHTYLDRVHAKFVRDDCVEVEGDGFTPHSLTITDSLFDGCHNFLSMRPSGTSHADAGTTPGRLTIENSLAWVQPMPLSASDCLNQPTHCPGGLGNHVLFKWSSAAVSEVVVRNTVFRVDQPSAFSIRGMHWPDGTYENVTLVWTWPRPHTDYFQVPPGVSVVNDVRVWDAAKAAWQAGSSASAPVYAAPSHQSLTGTSQRSLMQLLKRDRLRYVRHARR